MKSSTFTIFLSLLMMAFFNEANGQQLLPGQSRLFDTSGGYITEIPFATEETRGEIYMWENWKSGEITLNTDQVIDQYDFRYAIDKNQFEIKSDKGVKILHGERVKLFTVIDLETRKFEKSSSYDLAAHGFVEKLIDDSVILVAARELEFVPSNYVPQFDVGSAKSKYVQKTKYYMIRKGETVEFVKSTKKNLRYFDPFQNAIRTYINNHGLKFNQEQDLKQIIIHYNNLLSNS